MSSRVVVAAALLLALGTGVALYLVNSDATVSRTTRGSDDTNRGAGTTRSSGVAQDEPDGSTDPAREGVPRPTRTIDQILASLESGSEGDPMLVRRDLRDLRELLASLRGSVDRRTRKRILGLLTTLEPRWRAHAGTVIGELNPDPDTVQTLLAMLAGEGVDESTRLGVLNALWSMPAEAASGPLLEMIGKNRPEEAQIVQAIARIGQPESISSMVPWLDRPIPPATRLAIEKALTLEAGSEALDAAMAQLGTASPGRRLSLLLIVSRIGGEHYGDAVRRALGMGLQPDSRRAAIRALGTIGDLESGRVLWNLAQSENVDEARLATRALADIRNRETLDALITEASSIPLGLQRAILDAGSSIRRPGPALLDFAELQLNSEDKRSRVAAIAVAGSSRKPWFIVPLGELFDKHSDKATRTAIFDALWDMQQRESTRTALALLESTPPGELRDLNLKRFKSRAGLRPEDAPR